jgi:hypothetical protein
LEIVVLAIFFSRLCAIFATIWKEKINIRLTIHTSKLETFVRIFESRYYWIATMFVMAFSIVPIPNRYKVIGFFGLGMAGFGIGIFALAFGHELYYSSKRKYRTLADGNQRHTKDVLVLFVDFILVSLLCIASYLFGVFILGSGAVILFNFLKYTI